ncbi:nucleolar transcription factor 1-A-like [Aphis craccivora]|uniref:Nucleolar transcription factor 1-A-like n=1 Tax=Aphis craccivora TaxID=307492 RepID=A0A6G0VQG2_APHCR|nr:nucleolar transcription factor 1-A-like [Aphis craccivora]
MFFIHGPEIIESALLPIGQLTEEAQEARNKDFKRYREHNSRKCSREKTNLDILNLFLLSSDPVISTLALLKSPDVLVSLQYAKDTDDDDDDDNGNDDDYDEDNDSNEDNNHDLK